MTLRRRPVKEPGARAAFGGIAKLLEAEFGVPKPSRRERDLAGRLIGTILSQNTTDVNSTRAYRSLRERFGVWGEVGGADVRSIASAIRSGGLAKTKARRIKAILLRLEKERGEPVLDFLDAMSTDDVLTYLGSFEGVGLKTAACVALFGLGREVVPVDTHVHRVVGRLGVVGRPKSRDATFRAIGRDIPRGLALSLHINMIRLGRTYCRPRDPLCGECPLERVCAYGREAAARQDRPRR